MQFLFLFNVSIFVQQNMKVWNGPSTAKSLNKIESLQKKVLRFLNKNFSISYEGLIEKAGKMKTSVNTLRILCGEIR